jgi:hypothetical protein
VHEEADRARLVDIMIDAYVEWREACVLEEDAYRPWAGASGAGARTCAFKRYAAELETEEVAADAYGAW